MKITSKTVAIISSIVVVGITSVLLYTTLWEKDLPEVLSDNNWLYRKSVSINNNTETSLINEDVLLVINTEELISSKKLSADCSDLRFLNLDDNTMLGYWIEGGCNEKETEIWVRIPELKPEGKTIYMYYGNEQAVDSQEPWNGKFIIQSQNECKEGWKNEEVFNNNFIRAGKSYGESGGKPNHTHSFKTNDSNDICEKGAYISHNNENSVNGTVINTLLDYSSDLPEYKENYFCSSKNGFLKEESIIMFDTETPLNWEHYSELDEKFPVGEIDTTLNNNSQHNHKVLTSKLDSEGEMSEILLLTTNQLTTSEQVNLPPFFTINYIKNNNNSFAPHEAIVMFDEIPPLGWEYYQEIEGYFPTGRTTGFKEVGGYSSHSHILSVNIEKITASLDSNNYKKICIPSTNPIYIESTNENTLPPYITVIFAKKKVSQDSTISAEISSSNNLNIEKEYEKKENLTTNEEATTNIIASKELTESESGSVLGVSAPGKPTSLLTNGLTNPLFLQSPTPYFSAIYSDPDEDSASAYQIQVNSSSEFSGTEMWDSTKTATTITHNTRSANYTYDGTTLTNSSNTLYWRIRFWDIDDEVSEWSDTAQFVDFFNKMKLEGLSLEGISLY